MRGIEGKVAIITGGGGGLGGAAARRLVEEGARVVVADVVEDAAKRVADPLGENALPFVFDYRDLDSVQKLIDAAVDRWGRLDILHNNAVAMGGFDGTIEDADTAVWDLAYEVSIRGYMVASKLAIPHMRAGGGGVIINMGSDAALAGDTELSAYGATKAAVLALTRYIATQNGKQGIRSVSITPGVVLTDAARNHLGPEQIKQMEGHHVTPRLGEPADLAGLVAFLSSADAEFITGINIPLDGGYLSHMPTFAERIS